jgi:hypothetical protein
VNKQQGAPEVGPRALLLHPFPPQLQQLQSKDPHPSQRVSSLRRNHQAQQHSAEQSVSLLTALKFPLHSFLKAAVCAFQNLNQVYMNNYIVCDIEGLLMLLSKRF